MQIKRKMLDLYKRLGRVRESMLLEKELEGHPVKSVITSPAIERVGMNDVPSTSRSPVTKKLFIPN